MGIPSFYKRLIQTIKGLVSPLQLEGRPTILGFDANCAIYDAVASLSKRKPYNPIHKSMWESELIEETIRIIEKIIKDVNPSEGVWVAFDGVAPMAKIRQQRGRRFKSVPDKDRWNTNAITPGTIFMNKLGDAFHVWARRQTLPVHMSATDEPGEGEQKLMARLRANPTSHMVVYGLDADLIVLALLHTSHSKIFQLYREDVAFGLKSAEKRFLYLSIELLAKEVTAKWKITIDEFAACINLLGNDFIPHGLGYKIREEGMERMLECYQHIRISNPSLVSGYEYHTPTLKAFLQELAKKEPDYLLEIACEKLTTRPGQYCSSSDPVERAKAEENDLPIVWAAEKVLIEDCKLRSNYKEAYQRVGLWGASHEEVSKKYLEALAWCFAYYKGVKVDMEWYYPWWVAPLLESVKIPDHLTIPTKTSPPLQPTDQLAMVLPLSSYSLLPASYQSFPFDHPELFPIEWPMMSLGRRFLWECEPMIPLVLPSTIQTWKEVNGC